MSSPDILEDYLRRTLDLDPEDHDEPPRIPTDLVAWLHVKVPVPEVTPEMTLAEINRVHGQRDLVNYLLALWVEQDKSDHDDEDA